MRKLYTLVLCLVISASTISQLTLLKSGGSSSYGGAGIGNRVIFANFSTGSVGSTDGTVANTIDINSVVLSNGNAVAGINGKIVFAGMDIIGGSEIWASDGTVAGTTRLMDINPGAANSDPQGGNNNLPVVNNTAYFTAVDASTVRKLYKTDGTVAGTALVKDLGSVTIGFPFIMNPVGNTLYFTVNGKQLWKSDGTSAGTVMVKDFSPGATTTFSNFFVGNGTYTFFLANDGTNGMELWRTDGTLAGTIMINNYGAGSADGFTLYSGEPDWNFYMFNNTLYFQPNNVVSGDKIYKTDGTIANTSLMIDLNPSGGGVNLASSITIWNNFYFQAMNGLYKSDGTAAGTALVKTIGSSNASFLRPQENLTNTVSPGNFAGGRFFFIADDGTNGKELWVSDGTSAGTFMLKNIAAGIASAFTGSNDRYFYTKYKLYFAANDGVNGTELWETDGTTGGTVMTSNIYSGASSSSPDFYGVSLSTNKLVFGATDATGNNIYSLNATVVPFPLSLTDFTAALKGSDVVLNWHTENELNTSYFNLQRSINGKEFSTIGKVYSNGTGGTQSYQYSDHSLGKSNILYYRLEMIDKDGKSSYSKVISIKQRIDFDFSIVSSRGEAVVGLGDYSGRVTVRLCDNNGRVLLQQQQNINGGELIRMPLSSLASGIYLVVVEADGSTQTKRLVH